VQAPAGVRPTPGAAAVRAFFPVFSWPSAASPPCWCSISNRPSAGAPGPLGHRLSWLVRHRWSPHWSRAAHRLRGPLVQPRLTRARRPYTWSGFAWVISGLPAWCRSQHPANAQPLLATYRQSAQHLADGRPGHPLPAQPGGATRTSEMAPGQGLPRHLQGPAEPGQLHPRPPLARVAYELLGSEKSVLAGTAFAGGRGPAGGQALLRSRRI